MDVSCCGLPNKRKKAEVGGSKPTEREREREGQSFLCLLGRPTQIGWNEQLTPSICKTGITARQAGRQSGRRCYTGCSGDWSSSQQLTAAHCPAVSFFSRLKQWHLISQVCRWVWGCVHPLEPLMSFCSQPAVKATQ